MESVRYRLEVNEFGDIVSLMDKKANKQLVAPGKSIGGDYFGNYEGVLPDGKYHECDIDTKGKKSRGSKRIVFDDKGNIYYTSDHYQTFTQLY